MEFRDSFECKQKAELLLGLLMIDHSDDEIFWILNEMRCIYEETQVEQRKE